MTPSRTGVPGQRIVAPGDLAAEGKVTRLPRGELEDAGDQEDDAEGYRHDARQSRLLHRNRCQGNAERKAAIPKMVQKPLKHEGMKLFRLFGAYKSVPFPTTAVYTA